MTPSRLTLATTAFALLTLPASAADHLTTWRLFVADHAEPAVTALDLETGAELARFALSAPASLYTTESGEAVYAVQGAGDVVNAIATGLVVDDHGDHADIEITDPALVEPGVEGERPVHFVAHHGRIALFFDGAGTASFIDEHNWLEGDITGLATLDSGAPHHGVAVPWGEHAIVSVPNPDDPTELPIGIAVHDAVGNQLGDIHACPDLHGEASSGNMLAVACATGLLVVTGSGEPQIDFVPYSDLPEGKVTTLAGGKGLQYFLGNFGADRVVFIDPTEAEPFRLLDLPTRRVHFAVDPVRPRFAYVFTEDGQLHQLDAVSGAIVNSVTVTEPYSMDGEWNLPRPRIAVAGDQVLVTDPLAGTLHRIDVESFEVAGEIAMEGMPYNIVAVGASGTVH